MSIHSQFTKFDAAINLTPTQRAQLEGNRQTLRKKIKNYFDSNGWTAPKFRSQGSFTLGTNLNPIRTGEEDYDLDDGMYFICNKSEMKPVGTYHQRIQAAVRGHANGTTDKPTAVRVLYTDHHVDLPIYWMPSANATPMLAHKRQRYIPSDPKAFGKWVDRHIKDNEQLVRIIRYLKAWADWIKHSEKSPHELPSGFILTILACNYFVAHHKRDDLAFSRTALAICSALEQNFSCERPTAPQGEELLKRYDKSFCLQQLRELKFNIKMADMAKTEIGACYYWRRVFGCRFPHRNGIPDLKSSHRAPPRWGMQLKYRVSLKATCHPESEPDAQEREFAANDPLRKGLTLYFRATTNAPKAFKVYWQVVNTGGEATAADNLRGTIRSPRKESSSPRFQKESTLYKGTHWIECFIVKNGVCIARSNEFFVNIK